MYSDTLAEIKKYLQSVKPLFINGQIRLVSEDWRVKITYKDSFMDFTIKEKLKRSDTEAESQVVWFALENYYLYERDWKPKDSEFLSRLLNISQSNERIMQHRILHKLQVHGELIFWKEKKTEYVQNHRQESEWNLISEEPCSTDTWEKKERVEVPLW